MRPKDRYYGDTALSYEQRRASKPKWHREHAAVDTLLAQAPANATVLDVPVGTGRFLPLYKKHGLRPVGVDISRDMLVQAGQRADELGIALPLLEASVTHLPLPTNSVDATVCLRLVYSFTLAEVESVLVELARVTTTTIILSDRQTFPLSKTPVAALPRALGRRGKRLAGNLRERRHGRPMKTFHPEEALRAVFDRVGLDVADNVIIERIEGLFDYRIWVLRRRGTS